METLDTLTQNIDHSLENAYKEYQENFDKLVAKRDLTTTKLRTLRSLLPRIIDGLAKEHLVVTTIGYYIGDSTLSATVTAKSDGKFRFIKFQGYSARGGGKNQEALNTKAEKLKSKLKESTLIDRMNVNSMSMEVRREGNEGTALIEIYL